MSTPKIEVVFPQFTRKPGMVGPAAPPVDRAAWDALRTLDKSALKELGLNAWNNPNNPEDAAEDGDRYKGKTLMLFPGEWFAHIPAGYEIHGIMGEHEPFDPDTSDDDIRFGCLPYGILV